MLRGRVLQASQGRACSSWSRCRQFFGHKSLTRECSLLDPNQLHNLLDIGDCVKAGRWQRQAVISVMWQRQTSHMYHSPDITSLPTTAAPCDCGCKI
jgi:hypothetical protein